MTWGSDGAFGDEVRFEVRHGKPQELPTFNELLYEAIEVRLEVCRMNRGGPQSGFEIARFL